MKYNKIFIYLVPVAFIACGVASAQQGNFSPIEFSIQSQPIGRAMSAWSQQTGYQVLLSIPDSQNDTLSHRVEGAYTPETALRVLLSDTDFSYQLINDRTVAVHDSDSSHQTASASRDIQSGGDTLAQVIVSAQKRDERLEDVPVPVTVLSTDKLSDSNQLRFEDYYASIPGVNVAVTGAQSFQVSIRGLSSGSFLANPTVGVAIDDVPYGSALLWGGGASVPNIDPSDLARIEVLRGPQGTLYGTSSLGGLLKFVTVDPSTDKLSGQLQVGSDTIKGANGMGYSVRGSINVPISENFALRASGYTRTDPGYVDDVLAGKRDVNEVRGKGGRLSALWRISEAATLKLSVLTQRTETDGSADVLPSLGDLRTSHNAGTGAFTKDVQAFSALLTAKLGLVELTSLSGYSIFKNSGVDDVSGGGGLNYVQDYKSKKFSQELRLSMPLGERVNWLVGAFYTKEHPAELVEDLVPVDPLTGLPTSPSSIFLHLVSVADHQEYAAFTNFTFNVTKRVDVQVGGRQARYKQHFQQVWNGGLAFDQRGVDPFIPPATNPKDNAFTYLVTPRFTISPDLMVYARFASGYRTGGPNSGLVPYALPTMKPDATQNYELGLKGNFFDRSFSVDASLYYIKWHDLQVNATENISTPEGEVGASVYTNADTAKSQGLEISLGFRPLKGLTVSAWGAWNTAELTANVPENILLEGRSGDRLPDGARFSGHLALEQEFALGEDRSAFVGGAVSYIGDRLSGFLIRDAGGARYRLPSYVRTDLTAGVRLDSWNVGLYMNNVFDKRGLLTYDVAFGYVQLIQPRSVGLSIAKSF